MTNRKTEGLSPLLVGGLLAILPQQIASFKVFVRMCNELGILPRPSTLFLGFLDISPVRPFKHPVAGRVVARLLHILPHTAQDLPVIDARRLEHRGQIVNREMPVRTPMSLAHRRSGFTQDLLTAVGTGSAIATVAVTANIAVGMAHVVLVPRVEFLFGESREGLSPKDDAVVQRQTDPLQEQRVLKATKMLQMVIPA